MTAATLTVLEEVNATCAALPPAHPAPGRGWACVGCLALCCSLAALPFCFVSFPPSTDLPQHVSQIRLLLDTWQTADSPYSIQWYGPNNLVYLVLGAMWFASGPTAGGRLTLLVLMLLWVGAAFLLASRRGRPVSSAILASTLTFNFCVYWGFLNFLIGWPVFVLWLLVSLQPLSRRKTFLLIILSGLLYASHAMWFATGCAWLVMHSAVYRSDWRQTAWRLASVVPVGALSVFWFADLASIRAAGGFQTNPLWVTSPHERMTFGYLVDSMFGGLYGPVEPLAGCVVWSWIALGSLAGRGSFRQVADMPLLLCGGLLVAVVLVAPDKYMNTIFFAQRWCPCCVILLILGLPAPRLNGRWLACLGLAVLGMLSVTTARTWGAFQTQELSGLKESLAALPPGQRVLGLDLVQKSNLVKGRPFLQTFAYAQALRGASPNFSFAEHASGLVRCKQPHSRTRVRDIVWFPKEYEYVRLDLFDYVLVNGTAQDRQRLEMYPHIREVTTTGRWHLYKVLRPG